MRSIKTKTFLSAFKAMTPLITGIIPTAMAFALLARDIGVAPLHVILTSLLVFAGSVQFVMTELIGQHVGYIQFALIIFLVHSRHMFYGLSLFERFNKTGKWKPLMIFWLTDEAYTIITGTKLPKGVSEGLYYVFLAAIFYAAWNIGTLLGVFASDIIPFDTAGMDFAFTALFTVILIDQIRGADNKLPFIIGGLSGAVSLVVLGSQSMLLGCAVLSVILLLVSRQYIEKGETQ